MITQSTESCALPTQWGEFRLYAFEDTENDKVHLALESMQIKVAERLPIHTSQNPHNEHYLKTKAGKLGHMFD